MANDIRIPTRARGTLAIRVSPAERRILEAAAAMVPEYVSAWVRETALTAARQQLAKDPAGNDR